MPNTTFRGENGGAVVDMCSLLYKIYDLKENGPTAFNENPLDEKSPLYGINFIDVNLLIHKFNDLYINNIINPKSDDLYVGWKENWFDPYKHGKQNIKRYLEIFKKLFPNIKIIFNIRNVEDTSKSKTLAGRDNIVKNIQDYHDCFRHLHNINFFEGNSVLLSHDEWSNNGEHIYKKLHQLDLPVDKNSINKILSQELIHMRHL